MSLIRCASDLDQSTPPAPGRHSRHDGKKDRFQPRLPAVRAARTVGLVGADLATVVNKAALVATRRKADCVQLSDFTQAIERVVAGVEKKTRVLNARDREVIAFHEMGHALTALALPGSDAVHKVSIIPHGIGALGYTLSGACRALGRARRPCGLGLERG